MLENGNLKLLGAAAIVTKSDQINHYYVLYILCGCNSNEICRLH